MLVLRRTEGEGFRFGDRSCVVGRVAASRAQITLDVRKGDSIRVGDTTLRILRAKGSWAKIAVESPSGVHIVRLELGPKPAA